MNYQKFAIFLLALMLAACGGEQQSQPMSPQGATATATQSPRSEEKLGTQWGDEISSSVEQVELRRAQSQPLDERVLNYSAKQYQGQTINNITLASGKVEWSVQGDDGQVLPLTRHNGSYYLHGQDGQAYRLVYRNQSDQIYEIVASVDGIDVIDGSAGSRNHSGYVLYPHDKLIIQGFRKSSDSVASFIFGSPNDSYAAHSDNGSVQNVGVIGTAVFELYDPNAPKSNQPNAFPADNGYAKPPK